MNKSEQTIVGGIRLTPDLWVKFRAVWKHKGRQWFFRMIEREHAKIAK